MAGIAENHPHPPVAVIAVLCIAGGAFLFGVNWGQHERLGSGGPVQDFSALYAGAALVGTPDLYNPKANLDFQQRVTGQSRESIIYTRPPYWAAVLKPLTWLDYKPAILLWKYAMAAALAAFALLQPVTSPRLAAVAICWFIPVADAFYNGQDSPLLLLWIALSLRFHKRERDFLAGLVLSLAAAKFHFLILFPLLILLQRRWRFLAGLSSGAFILLAASFAVQGWQWPMQYYAVLRLPQITVLPAIMPTLVGVLSLYHAPMAVLIFSLALILLAVAAICRMGSFEAGFAACLMGAVMISPHAYLHDLTVLLPALLIFTARLQGGKWLAFGLLTPIPFVVLPMATRIPGTALVAILTSALLVMVAIRLAVRAEPLLRVQA